MRSRGTGVRLSVPRWLAGPLGDVVLYTVSAVLAAGLAAVTIYHGHRVWGLCSVVAYLGGALATLALHRRRTATHRGRTLVAAAVFAASALVPLVILVTQRVHDVPWSAQPEVDVVERMARLLLDTGTPYANLDELGRPIHFLDYTPYLPAMAVFGLPRALAGDHPVAAALTDARLVFALTAAALVALALRVVRGAQPAGGHRTAGGGGGLVARGGLMARGGAVARAGSAGVPVRAVQLVAVLPATTLTLATGGDDLPVLALLVLALACCHAGRVPLAAVAGGVALAMKLTAAPVLLVLAVALHTQSRRTPAATDEAPDGRSPHEPGQRGAGVFAAVCLAVAGLLVLPSLLVSPHELVEHVIRFPAGLTGVDSPAASPLPGYLLAQAGDVGRVAALLLLGLAALAILVWVLRDPPRTAAGAAERAAISLTVAMLLMPATRYGYLVYPLVLTGGAIALRSTGSFAMRTEMGESGTAGRGSAAPASE